MSKYHFIFIFIFFKKNIFIFIFYNTNMVYLVYFFGIVRILIPTIYFYSFNFCYYSVIILLRLYHMVFVCLF